MSVSEVESPPRELRAVPAWSSWLATKLIDNWRPGEWFAEQAVFVGDPRNELTALYECSVKACGAPAQTPQSRCQGCRKAFSLAAHREDFNEWYRPRRRGSTPPRYKGVSEFDLAAVGPGLRHEILFGAQQRDVAGLLLVPQRYRRILAQIPDGVDTLLDLGDDVIAGMGPATAGVARSLVSHVRRARLEFDGVSSTDGDVWVASLVGLRAGRGTSRTYVAVSGEIDFRGLRQDWLREMVKEYGRAIRPSVAELRQTVQAAQIASIGLSGRSSEHTPDRLGMADMSAIADHFRATRKSTGKAYSVTHRHRLFAIWRELIDYSRQSGFLDKVPGAFAINPKFHSMPRTPAQADEDSLGKAIPEHVIAQLDANIALLGVSNVLPSGGWSPHDYALMYQTIYAVLRDTGRRPGEITGLIDDCVERVDGKPTLIYNNYKRRRYRRRLPISESTAQAITAWQSRLHALPVEPGTAGWLFPTPGAHGRPRKGHVSTTLFSANVFRRWVDEQIPEIVDDHLNEAGDPAPYDRAQIVCYGFRHAYAQRHADGGTAPDVLKELLDHRSLDTTMGYYRVSLSRKQTAVETVAPHVIDRDGNPQGHSDALAYQLATVAVPFGGCAEPSNVKAGGGHCPIRFQCPGCSYYRPDPSYLPAIEHEIADLRSGKEFAIATGAQPWVVANFDNQIRDQTTTVDTMRAKLDALPDDQRIAVDEASKELRKTRSAQAFIPLDSLTVRPTE